VQRGHAGATPRPRPSIGACFAARPALVEARERPIGRGEGTANASMSRQATISEGTTAIARGGLLRLRARGLGGLPLLLICP